MQHDSCLQKQNQVISILFSDQTSKNELYDTLIRLGSQPRTFDSSKQTSDYLVQGCQSDLYLYEIYENDKLYFFTYTDALISSGLASLFVDIYSGESPETVLTCTPLFFNRLKPYLSMGRMHGGESLFMKMKQIAVQYLIPARQLKR